MLLVSSRDYPWLRDPPSGVLNNQGECCPSDESLCQIALGGFRFVSWECTHASALRGSDAAAARRNRRQLSSPAPVPPPGVIASADSEGFLTTLSPAPAMPTYVGQRMSSMVMSPGPSPPPM